ncbi:DUF1778 domain-containing protein [Xanthomonas campestris pv. campestris]|nr:DUF1778 domain-containing protein [Xanthomonas campestris]QCX68031.1 DUF1778 domain-containing protein [Xanthomonas campestris pv. campestris]QCX71472.1 DUF1778 domain-containing protein [Xanthomonas campestris pv. campestris]
MEFKTSSAMKELLSQAAALNGLDLTSFVLGSAVEQARRVINEHSTITLNQEGQAALSQLLANPQRPTAAMRQLMDLPDLPLRQK